MEKEKELITRCMRGEARAWDELFERYYSAAGKFIYQLNPVFTFDDVEEITQEVFLAVIRNLHNFHGRSAFQTWLFRIAANKARDYSARLNAAKRGGGAMTYSLDAESPESGLRLDPPSNAPAPDDALWSQERMTLLRESLDELGDPCRELIELKYFGDQSYDEIAQELELNSKTVSSRLSKCLDKLEAITARVFKRENLSPFPV
ncbi:MAG: RNA polymerase sigma factor [Verrucomicrobiota bacterium]